MIDVHLVNMPYVALQRPSIALGMLASILERDGIHTQVCYANLEFAVRNEWLLSGMFGDSAPQDCMGDWTFSRIAFPEYESDPEPFLQYICRKYSRDANRAKELRQILLQVREEAEHFVDELAREIAAGKPRIVGCTSTFQQHVSSLALLRRLRQVAPEVVTMIGGANCESCMGLTTHRYFDWVDYVVSGEADSFITELCRLAFEFGGDAPAEKLPYGVFGRVHRRQGYPVQEGEVPRAITNKLDGLPAPIYDSYFDTLGRLPFRDLVSPSLSMETSRGCWWGQKAHCTFCGLNGNGMGFRSRAPHEILDELDILSKRYGHSGFEMVDNILDMKYFQSLLPELAAKGAPYKLFYEVKSNLTRNQVRLLREAGVTWIQPGIESLHSEVLKLMNKGVRASTNVQLLKWCREMGIRLSWSILYRFPLEKDEWYAETAEWLPLIYHLQAPVTYSPVRIDRYSPYHKNPERYGLRLKPGRMYSKIYPVPEQDLSNLVYFFNYEGEPELPKLSFDWENSPTPGVDAVGRCIGVWQKLFWQEMRMLCMTEMESEIHIFDSRPCASERSFRLRDLNREVFLVCDDAPSLGTLQDELWKRFGRNVSGGTLAASVAELKERKILLDLDGRLISLAVRGDIPPLPKNSEFPGGHLVYANRDRSPIRSVYSIYNLAAEAQMAVKDKLDVAASTVLANSQ